MSELIHNGSVSVVVNKMSSFPFDMQGLSFTVERGF